MPLHNSIISNFMIYQDRIETNLLQLFAHPQNLEWFSIISVIIFEVNIVAEHVNARRMTVIVRFYTELKQIVLNTRYIKTMGVRREGNGHLTPLKMGLRIKIF